MYQQIVHVGVFFPFCICCSLLPCSLTCVTKNFVLGVGGRAEELSLVFKATTTVFYLQEENYLISHSNF